MYSSLNIFEAVKCDTCGRGKKCARMLVGKPQEMTSFWNLGTDRKIILINLEDTEQKGMMNWLHLAHGKVQWWPLVYTVMNSEISHL
jgi:hypothetical protein